MSWVDFIAVEPPTHDNQEYGKFIYAWMTDPLPNYHFDDRRVLPCCVAVDDDEALELLNFKNDYECWWWSMAKPGWCIDYCGVSILPTESVRRLADDWREKAPPALLALCARAARDGKYMLVLGV